MLSLTLLSGAENDFLLVLVDRFKNIIFLFQRIHCQAPKSNRGIYLVKMLMDDIDFNITETGSEIVIRKNLN